MGSRPTRTLFGLSLLLVVLGGPYPAAAEWPSCRSSRDDDRCRDHYLNAVTRQGDVELSVGRSCLTTWRHHWGRRDARRTVRQWLNSAAARATGGVCIPIDAAVREIRVTSVGGHCGYDGETANTPVPDVSLKRGGEARATLVGCHARISDTAFGGVALRFADSYGIGDSYVTDHFYAVYDAFGRDTVAPFGATVFAVSQYNTFHYRVEVLARGNAAWSGDHDDDDHWR